MIKSMTGYGRGEATYAKSKIVVEIRSLNSKTFDLSLRTPSAYRAMESQIRSAIGSSLNRGKVDVNVSCDLGGASQSSSYIDHAAFKAYYREVIALSREVGHEMDNESIISTILRLPDVVSSDRASVSDEERQAVDSALAIALESLNDFRMKEGGVLMGDILQRVALIGSMLLDVDKYEDERQQTVRTRLSENLTKAQVAIDANRFESELIYYLEKFDVTEEKIRLAQHLDYFNQVATSDGEGGRKLGFIAQEMGREINTLGSKANHAALQRLVVGMKDELEKIKEQLLNVL